MGPLGEWVGGWVWATHAHTHTHTRTRTRTRTYMYSYRHMHGPPRRGVWLRPAEQQKRSTRKKRAVRDYDMIMHVQLEN
jgi:hypothetical protein